MGIVIFIFYMLIMIMFPIHLAIQENQVYRTLNNRVKIATEMACFTVIRHLNADGMSQGLIQGNLDQIAIFKNAVTLAVEESIEIMDLSVQMENRAPFKVVQVSFTYPYKTKFILKSLITKIVVVHLSYELPIDI